LETVVAELSQTRRALPSSSHLNNIVKGRAQRESTQSPN